jgi:hypothetical protein
LLTLTSDQCSPPCALPLARPREGGDPGWIPAFAGMSGKSLGASFVILPREAGKGDRLAKRGGGRSLGLTAGPGAAYPLHHPSGGPPPPHCARERKFHSEQPQAFRAFQRAKRQQLAQRPAGRFRLRPFGRRHRAFAVPITRMRNETTARAAAARRGAIAPIAEQRALRLRYISVAVASTLHCLRVSRSGNGQLGAVSLRRIGVPFLLAA